MPEPTAYERFLASKAKNVDPLGFTIEPDDIHPLLFDWQRAIVKWAVNRGRAAIFADCGLGKTFMQLEWARLSGDRTLIVAPLSVARQTSREASKLGTSCTYVRDGEEVDDAGIYITNYEMVHRFDATLFDAVVLDESSILKNVDGPTRRHITAQFSHTPSRLACTATPAPNDVAELCNHAEFLGIIPRNEMLAAYFVHDEIGWRIKGHASEAMHEWMSQWAVALRRPSDLGWPDDGYDLPPMNVHAQVVEAPIESEGQLFATDLGGVGGRAKVRRETLTERCDRTVDLVASNAGQWIVWCGLNDEADHVSRRIDGAVNVHGSMSPEDKAEALEAFQDGAVRVLVTKPQIAGFGMNFQQCHQMVFVGMNDSYEAYYQAVRRCWRFGQTEPVEVHIVVSDLERQIVDNVRRKEHEASGTTEALVRYSQVTKEGHVSDRDPAVPHRRRPRRMLASTARR